MRLIEACSANDRYAGNKEAGENAALEDRLWSEIIKWRNSSKRQAMIAGERIYLNHSDANRGFNSIVHQKVERLLGKPIMIQSNNTFYKNALSGFFRSSMLRKMRSTCIEAVNKGIAWWHVYYSEAGELSFQLMRSEEIIPIWADEERCRLHAIIRDYEAALDTRPDSPVVQKVEWWDVQGVRRYTVKGDKLIASRACQVHFTAELGDEHLPMNWERVPFIAWKHNEEEQSFLELCMSVSDMSMRDRPAEYFPSENDLRSMHADHEWQTALMETEFQAGLEQLRWFIDMHLHNTGGVDYSGEAVSFVFNDVSGSCTR